MATSTTNLNLIKPAGSDKIRIAQINQNMDILDEKIGPVGNTSVQNQIIANDSGMAIVSTGNTHSAIASGQYVYIRSHSTLAEGLYKANSAISANATLSTSNVTHISSGGMNDLKGQIDSLNSHIEVHWFGNNTLANVQTAMVSFAQDVPDGGVRSIEFGISTATGKFGATNYIGKLERISASRLCVTVMNAMYSTNMVIGNYKDGTWYWDEVALASQLGGSKIFRISKTVTIPAGNTTTPGELEVDFSSDIGSSSIWAVLCTLNSNVLPYVSNTGAVKTWVRLLSGSPTKKIIIYNTDSAWTNYTLYTVLICA